VRVPDYRKVAGQWYNEYRQLIIIEDPELAGLVNNYHIREGAAEMEQFAENGKLLQLKNPGVQNMLKEKLSIEVEYFVYNSKSLLNILTEIRTRLINWLLEKQKEIISNSTTENLNLDLPTELTNLHPVVQEVASQLFKDGYYREAILNTYIALVQHVKLKSLRTDLDNTGLMQTVFSAKNPSLIISDDFDEQQGFMWLYSGAVMAIRNPKAHRLIEQNDPQRTIEWLSFASVLLRVMDDSKLAPKKSE
jgi:uncharacterized protein (TIGR02391 family)